MRYTVQYIPLSKIKPHFPVRMTPHLKKLKNVMWDCMHLLVVRKNQKDDNYSIVSGHSRYEYFTKHTHKKTAPCIVDGGTVTSRIKLNILHLFRMHNPPGNRNNIPIQITPIIFSIIREFLKSEPLFTNLSPSQKIKILMLALRYKKTVLLSMQAMLKEMSSK